MRVLHAADWHLGMDLCKVTLMEDQRRFKQQLKAIIEEECIDAVPVMGDVYSTTLAGKEVIELYDDIMYILCTELKKEMIVTAGNHDSVTCLASPSGLLEGMRLCIIGSLKEKVKGIRVDDYMIYPIPYFHVEQVRKVHQKDMHSQAEVFSCTCTDILSTAGRAYRPTIMAHVFLANTEICEGDRLANVDEAELVPSTTPDGLSHVVMGHLHRRRHVGGRVWYSGSPLPCSFSETDRPKGVLIYDSQTDTIAKRNTQFPHPPQVCRGSYADLKERMLKHIVPGHAYIKIEVMNLPTPYEMLDYFRQGYENLL